MYTKIKQAMVAGAAVAAIGLAGATTASAGYTVTGGGSFAANASDTTLTNTRNGQALTCVDSNASGSVANGSGLSGTGIGSISALSFSGCTGPFNLTFDVTTSGFPWTIDATGTTTGTGTTSGAITGITARLESTNFLVPCDVTVTGSVPISYENSTTMLHVLNSNATHQLTITSGSCAFDILKVGDVVDFNGSYLLDPETLNINGTP